MVSVKPKGISQGKTRSCIGTVTETIVKTIVNVQTSFKGQQDNFSCSEVSNVLETSVC